MKHFIFILAGLCFLSIDTMAQISFGVKGGITMPASPNANSIIVNRTSPRNEFLFNAISVENGFTAGVFAEQKLSEPFFLRGELMFHQFETTYELIYTWGGGERAPGEIYHTEKTQRIDVPVSLGVRLSNFEITSGLVARYVINQESDMHTIAGYEESLNPLQLGLQAGIGVQISNMQIGISYQMDFSNYADHMVVNGTSLALQNSPSRLVATIGYKF